MARSKSRLRIYAEAWPLLALVRLLAAMPLPLATAILRRAIAFVLLFLPARRRLMVDNLSRAFPNWTADQCRETADESIGYLAKGMAVFTRMPRETVRYRVENEALFDAAVAKGKGVIVYTAHYACWEMASIATHARHPHLAIAYRPLDNPLLDQAVAAIRGSTGIRLLPRRTVLREGLAWLRQNKILGILVDQNFASGGVFVDFFGSPAATAPVVSMLARRTGAEVLPIHARWDGDLLRLIWGPPLAPSPLTDARDQYADETQRMTKIVEGWIREDPAQWLWLHNRWKKQAQPGDWVWSSTGRESA